MTTIKLSLFEFIGDSAPRNIFRKKKVYGRHEINGNNMMTTQSNRESAPFLKIFAFHMHDAVSN